jgi:hypothetical protein
MITKFKIFENKSKNLLVEYLDSHDLVEILDDKFIEDYYRDNYWDIDFEEDIVQRINMWDHIDIDFAKYNFITDLIYYTDLEDYRFSKDDYIKFIEENLEKEYLVEYLEEKNVDNIKNMNKDQLTELMEDYDLGSDFMRDYFTDEYKNEDIEQLFIDVYGKQELENNLYPYIKNLINEEELIDYFFDKIVPFDIKMDYIMGFIPQDKGLQRYFLNLDPNTSEALFNEMSKDRVDNIGKEYDFQKAYLETLFNKDKDLYSEDEDPKNDIYSKALKELNDKFGLNDKIKEQYNEYTYLIDTEKYNL